MRSAASILSPLGLLLLASCAGTALQDRDLIGLSGPAVQETLGDPARVRHEASTEIWQYAGPACVLDVFLYAEKGGSAVVHVEARDLEGRKADSRRCLGSLTKTT